MTRLGDLLARRKWPLTLSAGMFSLGMLYMLFWNHVVSHGHYWTASGDLWGIWRAAHYVGWGYVGGVYDTSTGFNALPGMPVLLAPVAMLSGMLHLTESFPPWVVQHPSALLLLDSIEIDSDVDGPIRR